MNPETGRRFGPYEIQGRLGGGGMGHVYRAWDARLHREVAVKLLNHEYTMPGMRERFLREARAASALNHPNICTIFDIGEQDGDPYLVMELLQGETLRDRILNRTIQVEELICVARDCAEALGAAHAKGVVHRDIKPANIFLVDKPNGGAQAKVLDFGLAKIEGGALGARSRTLDITTAGATVGTLAYMSPEQARGEVLDSRSDLFSLGVVMYEMATRQVPFQGATSALVFVQLLNHAPEPVREWNEAVPRELEKIIFKLLAKERPARFQTARELELALIALTEKGSGGGWLRKAVATVPLVRAPDPIAREKRLRSPQPKTVVSDLEFEPAPRVAATPAPPSEEPQGSSDPQFFRPVARVPRGDTTPNPARLQSARENGVVSTYPKNPSASPSRRAGTPVQEPPANVPSAPAIEVSAAATPAPAKPLSGPTFKTEPIEQVSEPVSILTVTADQQEQSGEAFPPLLEPSPPLRFKHPIFHPVWMTTVALIVIAVGFALFYLTHRSRFAAVLVRPDDPVVVTEIENRTGDKSLDSSLAAALRIAIAQSPYFSLRSNESYLSARGLVLLGAPDSSPPTGEVLARQSAQRLGAKAFLYGSITGTASPYLLHVDLRGVDSNDVLASAESHVESLQQIPDAINQIAGDLRMSAGEQHGTYDQTSTPLAREGSANLAALQLYAQAQSLIATHEPVAAVADLQGAVALDPHFIQAHLLLAGLFHQLRAETAAADSARLALAAADGAGDRTRAVAQATYELETSGDYARASALLRHLVATYRHDAESLALLASTLRLQGHMSEALQFAQQASAEDPFNAAAYSQAEAALIALDRYDAAYQINTQAQRLGLARSADALTAAYLAGKQDVVEDISANIPVGKIEYRPDWDDGIYLDSVGRLAAGATLWRSRAGDAGRNESFRSAAALLLSQAALDRALLDDCVDSAAFLRDAGAPSAQQGRVALFNLAISNALCGDVSHAAEIATLLHQRYPQSFDVNNFYLADIGAAISLRTKSPSVALDQLQAARAFDLISLTPFLRGRAHVDLHQVEIGIVDFQTVLSHKGVTFLAGSDVYPAAEIGVARAFAVSGDLSNSADAYRRFIGLWPTADPASALLIEARTHSRP